MNQATTTQTQNGTVLVATQAMPEASASSAQMTISGDLGLIILGLVLLSSSGYLFVAKLCAKLASSENK